MRLTVFILLVAAAQVRTTNPAVGPATGSIVLEKPAGAGMTLQVLRFPLAATTRSAEPPRTVVGVATAAPLPHGGDRFDVVLMSAREQDAGRNRLVWQWANEPNSYGADLQLQFLDLALVEDTVLIVYRWRYSGRFAAVRITPEGVGQWSFGAPLVLESDAEGIRLDGARILTGPRLSDTRVEADVHGEGRFVWTWADLQPKPAPATQPRVLERGVQGGRLVRPATR